MTWMKEPKKKILSDKVKRCTFRPMSGCRHELDGAFRGLLYSTSNLPSLHLHIFSLLIPFGFYSSRGTPRCCDLMHDTFDISNTPIAFLPIPFTSHECPFHPSCGRAPAKREPVYKQAWSQTPQLPARKGALSDLL